MDAQRLFKSSLTRNERVAAPFGDFCGLGPLAKNDFGIKLSVPFYAGHDSVYSRDEDFFRVGSPGVGTENLPVGERASG